MFRSSAEDVLRCLIRLAFLVLAQDSDWTDGLGTFEVRLIGPVFFDRSDTYIDIDMDTNCNNKYTLVKKRILH